MISAPLQDCIVVELIREIQETGPVHLQDISFGYSTQQSSSCIIFAPFWGKEDFKALQVDSTWLVHVPFDPLNSMLWFTT